MTSLEAISNAAEWAYSSLTPSDGAPDGTSEFISYARPSSRAYFLYINDNGHNNNNNFYPKMACNGLETWIPGSIKFFANEYN